MCSNFDITESKQAEKYLGHFFLTLQIIANLTFYSNILNTLCLNKLNKIHTANPKLA